MTDLWQEPWLWPAISVMVGLPVLLILATEIAAALERRGNPAAKVVRLVRNFVLPLGALLLLLGQVDDLGLEVNATKVTSTVFGFVVILVLLSTLNIALFTKAGHGSWRQRVPSIFVDLVRLLVVVISLAALFSWVWGADVGGLFTALGVTSIVIGLALQNAAGSVVSGLLLLFEQPFRMGDWLEVGAIRGRVVEVNWRAVHIDTGNGIQIVPTATLAGSSFNNLSKVRGSYLVTVETTFTTDDAPFEVMALLARVAKELPTSFLDAEAEISYCGGAKYEVQIPVLGPGEESDTRALFLARLWYAARRSELHLDGDASDDFRTPERLDAALRANAAVLHLSEDEAAALAPGCRLEQFGTGETILNFGEVPEEMRFILGGRVAMHVPQGPGSPPLLTTHLEKGEAVGLGTYTRQKSNYSFTARSEVAVLVLPAACVDQLISANPRLAMAVGQASDNRRLRAADAQQRARAIQSASGATVRS
ncbi:MAG: mechanosensitive ion channel family protein [Specibacter sp.]